MNHSGKQRLFAVVLLISLAFNLFFAGILVGKNLGGYHHPPHPPRILPPLPRMLHALPEESLEKIRPLIWEHRVQMIAQRHRVRQARRVVHEQLTARNFNVEAFSLALVSLHQEFGKMQEIMHKVLVNIASQLDEKDRQRLSVNVGKLPRRHHFDKYPPDMPRSNKD